MRVRVSEAERLSEDAQFLGEKTVCFRTCSNIQAENACVFYKFAQWNLSLIDSTSMKILII